MLARFKISVTKIIVIALILLTGCRDSDKNSSLIFEELNESLERSNKLVAKESKVLLENLEAKSHKPETAEKANIWKPKADSIHFKTESILGFIDSLKLETNKANGSISKKQDRELYGKLKSIRAYVLNCDPEIKIVFENRVLIFDKSFEDRIKDENQFHKINFNESNLSKSKATLTKLESDLLITENDLVSFCHNKSQPGCDLGMESYSAIITGNSKHFKGGEEIIIHAGMGQFNSASKPKIIINGLNIESQNGLGIYKTKVGNKPGKYKVPLKISYKMQNGKDAYFIDTVEYTVDE